MSVAWWATIEEPIRPLVKLLRDNGINTVSSCGHALYVQAELYDWACMDFVYKLLAANGYRGFTLSGHKERVGGNDGRPVMLVQLHKHLATPAVASEGQ